MNSSVLFKPMLATDADLTKLVFPLLASAKLDGVRDERMVCTAKLGDEVEIPEELQ